MPGFQSFSLGFLHHFVLAKLATTSIRVIGSWEINMHIFFKENLYILLKDKYS